MKLGFNVICFAFLVSSTMGESSNMSLSFFNSSEYEVRDVEQKRLYDLLDGHLAPATCSNDMRSKMPGCHQFGSMWCWATGVAELAEFYKGGPAKCDGLECEIVGWCPDPKSCGKKATNCCPLSSHKSCGTDGATNDMIFKTAKHFTGHTHKLYGGPMPQATLDATLKAGKPILMLVGSHGSAYHVVSVAGCGGGSYYFHDPEWKEGVYKEYDYSKLLKSSYDWIDTVYRASSESSIVV